MQTAKSLNANENMYCTLTHLRAYSPTITTLLALTGLLKLVPLDVKHSLVYLESNFSQYSLPKQLQISTGIKASNSGNLYHSKLSCSMPFFQRNLITGFKIRFQTIGSSVAVQIRGNTLEAPDVC